MSDDIKLAAELAGQVLEKTNFYEDTMQPVCKELGKTFGIVGKAVNIALTPISTMIWGYDKISNYINASLEKKLTAKKIAPESIIPPDPSIAGPLINNMRFLGAKESLRDMYTNLLATSMNEDTASIAHPCFVEIIKQLSSDEAKIMALDFDFNNNMRNNVIVNILAQNPDTKENIVFKRHISLIPYASGCEYPDSFPTYVANLSRLGLISTYYDYHYKKVELYNELKEDSRVKSYIEQVNEHPVYKNVNLKGAIKMGRLELTPLGIQFQKACIG